MSASVALASTSAPASPVLPSFETIARLTPLADPEGREITEVLRELNQAIEAAGIEFGENRFSWLRYNKCAPDRFEDYRWIDCTAVRGCTSASVLYVDAIGPPGGESGPATNAALAARIPTTAATFSVRSVMSMQDLLRAVTPGTGPMGTGTPMPRGHQGPFLPSRVMREPTARDDTARPRSVQLAARGS